MIGKITFAEILLCVEVNNAVLAGGLLYTCDVTHIYDLADEVALEASGWHKLMKGSSFSVSRVTGEIIGEVIPTLAAESTKVINRGSEENSFKALADFGNQVQVLEVQEFLLGATRSFVALSMGGAGIFTGL